jgi:hypothetical protein
MSSREHGAVLGCDIQRAEALPLAEKAGFSDNDPHGGQ